MFKNFDFSAYNKIDSFELIVLPKTVYEIPPSALKKRTAYQMHLGAVCLRR